MNAFELLQTIRDEFVERLQSKTGWGRNDVLVEFDRASAAALAKALDEANKK